jgi:tRNA/rRNA methyltransferase
MRYALAINQSIDLLPHTHGHANPGNEPASNEKVQALLIHFEQALIAVQFLDPSHPKKLMPRMRHMLSRNALSNDEVDLLRGLCTAMIKTAKSAGHATMA